MGVHDKTTELRISAAVVAGEARLLPLEMPELLVGGPLAPPPDVAAFYTWDNAWETCNEVRNWVERCAREIGGRCGRPGEYEEGCRFVLEAAFSKFLPERGPISARELEERGRRLWLAREKRRQSGDNPVAGSDAVVTDAIRTTLALLAFAGELLVDEGTDTFRRVYPVLPASEMDGCPVDDGRPRRKRDQELVVTDGTVGPGSP